MQENNAFDGSNPKTHHAIGGFIALLSVLFQLFVVFMAVLFGFGIFLAAI